MKRLLAYLFLVLGLLLSGNAFAGCIEGDCINGQGTYTGASGEKYVGEYKDGLPNGQGTATYPNRDKYVGKVKNSKMHGRENGIKTLLMFKMHGRGTYTFANGTVVVGIFKKDELVKKISGEKHNEDFWPTK